MRWQTAEKHCVQRYSQKAFQSTNRHRLPWIYTVALTAPWYCDRNVGYLYHIYYINVDVYWRSNEMYICD